MSGKIKKNSKATPASSQKTSSDNAPSRIVVEKTPSVATTATNSSGGGDAFIRDLPPPSQMVQPRGGAMATASVGGAFSAGASANTSTEEATSAAGNRHAHFAHLEQPLPMTHSYSLPSLPTTSLRPRMSSILVDEGGESSITSLINRDLSQGDYQQPPTASLPLLSRTLSTPESSSNLRSAFGRAGSAFGRFSTAAAASRPNTYTQSDPGFSAFHPVSWSCQQSFSSAGSGSLVGSEIIEEHDVGSGLKTSAKVSSAPSNNMTRGFLLKAREKLQTTKLQSTKRRSGRENPARPSLNDSPPTTIITNNEDGVEISIVEEGKTAPPQIERVNKPPSKMGMLKAVKHKAAAKSKSTANEGQHEDPGLELNFSDDSDDESIDEVAHLPGVEVSLKPPSNRPPSRADNKMPFDESGQTSSSTTAASTLKTSAAGVAVKFKFKSPQRRSKVMNSPSSTVTSSSPHQSPCAGTTSSSSNGSPDSRGGLSTISSNSTSIASATANIRNKVNSASSSPGGGDSCAKESMASSTTNSEVRDIVRQSQKKTIRQPRPGSAEDGETASVDMDVNSACADSCNSPCLREGAINPHIGLAHTPGGTPSVSPNRFVESIHEAPFDEQSSGSPEVGTNTESKVSKFISFNSKKDVRSQSPHSTDAQSSAGASNASVSNTTSSSSGGGSQQPVMFVAYERVDEREESPFDEHHHEENRIATPQNLIRPTITSTPGQRPPTSPRKVMSGRMTTPPPHVHTTLTGFKTPASPPTIADRHVVVRDLAVVESGSTSSIPKPKSNRMKMILVPPKSHDAAPTVVSPEKHHSQANVTSGSQQQGGSELNSAIVSPEKAT